MEKVVASIRAIGGPEAVTELFAATRADVATLHACFADAIAQQDRAAYRESLHFLLNVATTLDQQDIIARVHEERTRLSEDGQALNPGVMDLVRDLADRLQAVHLA